VPLRSGGSLISIVVREMIVNLISVHLEMSFEVVMACNYYKSGWGFDQEAQGAVTIMRVVDLGMRVQHAMPEKSRSLRFGLERVHVSQSQQQMDQCLDRFPRRPRFSLQQQQGGCQVLFSSFDR
jgi:hypothetical protein